MLNATVYVPTIGFRLRNICNTSTGRLVSNPSELITILATEGDTPLQTPPHISRERKRERRGRKPRHHLSYRVLCDQVQSSHLAALQMAILLHAAQDVVLLYCRWPSCCTPSKILYCCTSDGCHAVWRSRHCTAVLQMAVLLYDLQNLVLLYCRQPSCCMFKML